MKQFLPKETTEANNESSGATDAASDIKGTVQSPQFQQALTMFSLALQSGQLAPLIREFDLGEEAIAAATAGNMELFIKALQKSKCAATTTSNPPPEDMALD